MSKRRLFVEWLAILLITLAIAAWSALSGITGRLDHALMDRALVDGARPADGRVLIVAIDDRSLAAQGQWPWDRRKIAGLIDTSDASGAKAILLDVLYTEPSEPEADAALAESLRRSGKVVMPMALAPAVNKVEGFEAIPPISPLPDYALALGHVGMTPDADGPVRRVALTIPDGSESGKVVQHLSVALHERISGRSGVAQSGVAQEVSAESEPAMQLRPAGSYRSISASAVIDNQVPRDFLAGKIVIIGATADGLGDKFPVSGAAGSIMSGAEILANAYQDVDQGGFLLPLPPALAIAFSAILIFILFAAFWALRPLLCVVVAFLCCLFAVGMSYVLATYAQLWFAAGPVFLALTLSYPLWGWRRLAAINAYLMGKAERLTSKEDLLPLKRAEGFDAVARSVNRLDFLVDELSERRDFLRRVVESTPDALCVFDADGKLMTMNQRARNILPGGMHGFEGMTARELLGRIGGRVCAEGKELHLYDGTIFVITRSIGQSDGHWPEIHLAMFTDVTAQRLAEEERRHALEFLSHDMRSPQVAILGLTADRQHDENEVARLSRIRRHAQRTLELADNFVQLARLSETPLDKEELELGTLADEAADRVFSLARERGAEVRAEMPEEPLFLFADGQVLSRVLDNLIGNAIKYGASKVLISVREAGGMARIVVSDNGPGLPEARRSDPFARFGARAGEGKGGAGLGLAFVRGAIEHHGGKVECQSSVETGTCFVISLPGISD